MSVRFQRQDGWRHKKLRRSGKYASWRRPNGRHSKMRKQRKSYPAIVRVGYKQSRKTSGKIDGLVPITVRNLKELARASKENVVIIGKVGAKKKIELLKDAKERKIKVLNAGGNEK